jgi:hypothetical protein
MQVFMHYLRILALFCIQIKNYSIFFLLLKYKKHPHIKQFRIQRHCGR